jgi:cytochrome c
MKTCVLCHGKLGLGVRSRNLWNGRWWVHARFCSIHCEVLYEQERYDATAHRWRTFLAPAAPEIPPKVRVEGQGQLHVGMTAW